MPCRLLSVALALVWAGACTGVVSQPGGDVPAATGVPPSEGVAVATASGFRRLSPEELRNTLTDLFGPIADPTGALRPFESAPYDNDVGSQAASVPLIQTYQEMVAAVVAEVMGDPEKLSAILPCEPNGFPDRACLRQFIVSFGERALRRPLTEQDVADYLAFEEFAVEANADPDIDSGYANDFYLAVELVLTAMLQDTEFLYRVEAGTPVRGDPTLRQLDDYEVARRMSYLLWGTAPDAGVLSAAAEGRLREPASRRAMAQQMLDDPRARAQMARFHSMWLGYRQLTIPNDLRDAFHAETSALLDDVIFDNPRGYRELFLADGSFMNRQLAEHYNNLIDTEGMSPAAAVPVPDGDELVWTSYGGSGRRGILSHGSFLASFGKHEDTSPTQRGILVRTRLLCQTISPPPADLGVNVDNPPEAANPDDCKIERYDQHRSDVRCAGCHEQLDPVGFGLENYDNQGRYRDHDTGRPECAIDGQGSVAGVGEFNGPAELAERLVETGQLEPCVVSQLMTFALGRGLVAEDDSVVNSAQGWFAGNDYDFADMLIEWVADESFGYRRDEGGL